MHENTSEKMLKMLERVLMECYKEGMIDFMQCHPGAFEPAISLALSDRQPYAWRAAWLLWSCMTTNDPRFQPHIPLIIKSLPGKPEGHSRELLKILEQIEIPETLEGPLFDCCVSIWEKIGKRPSVRYTAFKIILKLAAKYPELYQEVQFLTQDHYIDPLSPGIRRAIIRLAQKPVAKT